MTHPAENDAPVRSCCRQRHWGVMCPDGLVMCCLCFDRVPVERLHVTADGTREDACATCVIPPGETP